MPKKGAAKRTSEPTRPLPPPGADGVYAVKVHTRHYGLSVAGYSVGILGGEVLAGSSDVKLEYLLGLMVQKIRAQLPAEQRNHVAVRFEFTAELVAGTERWIPKV